MSIFKFRIPVRQRQGEAYEYCIYMRATVQKNKWLSNTRKILLRRHHVKLVPDCTQFVEIHPTMILSEERLIFA